MTTVDITEQRVTVAPTTTNVVVIWLLLVVGLVAAAVMSGNISVERFGGVMAPVVPTAKPLPTVALPNSQPAQPAAPPVVQPTMVVVVPQGQPVLPAQPTAVPTAIPVVTPFPQEFYQAPTPVLAAGAPAIGAPECNSQSAQFKGEKDVVLDTPPIDGNGIPLGHIAAWSCTSQDNVVVELQQRELEMIEKFKAKNSG